MGDPSDLLRKAREAKGLSQGELARLSGVQQSNISEFERGARPISRRAASGLARILGVPASSLLGLDDADAPAGRAAAPNARIGFLPILAAGRGGLDQTMFLSDGPLDWTEAPPYVLGDGAYAILMVGESMLPRYRPKQVLYVDPRRPIMPGDGVVLVKHDHAVLVKEFVRATSTEIVVREYQPEPRERIIRRDVLASVHAVAGLREP